MARSHLSFLLLTWLVLTSLGAGVAEARKDSSRLYVAGRRAVIEERWNEAVLYLTAAIERDDDEGGEVVIYGKHLEPYLPHFYLGVAFFELGALDAAFNAWRESERQDHHNEVSARHHPTLAEYLEHYGSRLASAQALQQSEAQLEALEQRLSAVSQTAQHTHLAGEVETLQTELRQFVAQLERLRAAMRPSAQADSSPTDKHLPLALLEQLSHLAIRTEELASEVEEAAWQSAAERLRQVRCDPLAVDDVLELLSHRGPSLESDIALQAATTSLAHALAEPCGKSRELLLALSQRSALLDALGPTLTSRLQGKVNTDLEQLKERGLERLESGGCHRAGIADLSRWLERQSLDDDFGSQEVAGRLATAHLDCAEPELAALYAPQAEYPRAQAPDPGELKETDPLVLADRWVQSTLRIDAGVCDLNWLKAADLWKAISASTADAISRSSGVPFNPHLYTAKASRNCGQREPVADFLIGSRAPEQPSPQAQATSDSTALEALENWYRREAASEFYTGRHALIFAAEDYDDGRRGWGNLPGARQDAEAVREALLQYGFDQVRLVVDPSSRSVRREIQRFTKRPKADAESQLLLVYWAGHGAVLQSNYEGRSWSTGFLVPVDVPFPHPTLDPTDSFVDRAVSMDKLDDWAREMPSRHAVFMLDSCYSGTAFRTFGKTEVAPRRQQLRRSRSAEGPWDPLERYRRPVRLLVTSSAADQQASDRSAFRHSLVQWLKQPEVADFRRDQVVSGSELCLHLTESTREASEGRQSPSCQSLPAPWDQGDVLFPVGSDRASLVSSWVQRRFLADLAVRRSLEEREDVEAWKGYLKIYPEGRFAQLARRALASSRTPSIE